MEEEKQQELHCHHCKHRLELGEDVLTVEEGVIGPRGVVPLQEVLVFCSERCLGEHFDGGNETVTLPRRVP